MALITTHTGEKIVVQETPEDVAELVMRHRQDTHALGVFVKLARTQSRRVTWIRYSAIDQIDYNPEDDTVVVESPHAKMGP